MNILESEALIQKERQLILDKESHKEQEALRKKQDFLSIMSHEIRTPLNAVTTTISLLKEHISDKNKELFGSLQFASNSLISIVNDILDFTKLDSNKAVLETHSSNFNVFCNNIYNLHKTQASKKGLVFRMNNGAPDYNYLLDQTKLSQILSNLINNAIKFTEKGSVTFTAKLIDSDGKFDRILFSVSDTGEGILKGNKTLIFNDFSQIKPITTRTQGGTGLGLPIVKKLVELHGGKIEVQSEINVGSSFYFTLRLERTVSSVEVKQTMFDALKGKTALVAEDTAINALLIKKSVKTMGCYS